MNIKNILKEKDILKSVSVNVISKPLSMIIGFFYTPLLLSYLGVSNYGVWATLLSILNWISVFDFGIGGGLRNLLSAKLVYNNKKEIEDIISTAYKILAVLVLILYSILFLVFYSLNWNGIFKTSVAVRPAVLIVLTYICLNFIFGLTNSILFAKQRSEFTSLISVLTQSLNFFGIFCLLHFLSFLNNRLINVAWVYTLAGVFVNLISLCVLWHKYPYFVPSLRHFNSIYIKDIFSFGFKLFLLQISAVIIFTTDNMIITRLYSPDQVTPYSISSSLFNVIISIFNAVLTPMLSRYTLEKEKKNYLWIKKSIKLQLLLLIPFLLGTILLIVLFVPITHLWLKKDIYFMPSLIVSTACYAILSMYTNIFSTFLNGISNINIQLMLSLIAAATNIPLSVFFAKNCNLGITGVRVGTIVCQIPGAIVFTIQAYNCLNKKTGKNEIN